MAESAGAGVAVDSVAEDFSALTSAEAFQKQAGAVEDLERLSKAKSDFISIVSHEFRTPLTGIQGFSETMRDENLSPAEM